MAKVTSSTLVSVKKRIEALVLLAKSISKRMRKGYRKDKKERYNFLLGDLLSPPLEEALEIFGSNCS
jgi:hypothetical protein